MRRQQSALDIPDLYCVSMVLPFSCASLLVTLTTQLKCAPSRIGHDVQLPHFHFLPVAAAAASDAPQGSWLEGGRARAEAEGRKLQEFFATKQTLLCHTGIDGSL